jgi:ABC-2 type transport system permease protein
MRHFIRVLRAEAFKQVRVYWGQRVNLMAEMVYPALHFATAYYMFRPLQDAGAPVPWLPPADAYSLAAFLLTGLLGFTIFTRLLWAAIGMTDMERMGGTLEIQYMTPASRFALLIGAAAGGMLRVVYLYLAFLAAAFVWAGEWRIAHAGMVVIALVALLVPGLAFGTLLNSRMLFTRDYTAYASILGPILSFLGGVRYPVPLLPGWMQALAAVLPLTWSLDVVRRVLLEAATLRDVAGSLSLGLAVSLACFSLGYWNLAYSERSARERGTLVLY